MTQTAWYSCSSELEIVGARADKAGAREDEAEAERIRDESDGFGRESLDRVSQFNRIVESINN